jgi:hypothetical protein
MCLPFRLGYLLVALDHTRANGDGCVYKSGAPAILAGAAARAVAVGLVVFHASLPGRSTLRAWRARDANSCRRLSDASPLSASLGLGDWIAPAIRVAVCRLASSNDLRRAVRGLFGGRFGRRYRELNDRVVVVVEVKPDHAPILRFHDLRID